MSTNETCSARSLQIQAQHPAQGYTTHSTLVAWLFFNISSSHLFLPLAIAAFAYVRPKRNPVMINLAVTWIIYGLVSSILLYSGHAEGCEPPPLLCLAQASLYIALPPMTTVALLCLAIQTLLEVRARARGTEPKLVIWRMSALVIAPYLTYAIFATAVAASGASNFEDTVSRARRFFYCSVHSSFLVNTVIGFCAIALWAAMGLCAWAIYIIYKNWSKLHEPWMEQLNYSYIFRIGGFAAWNIIAFGMAMLPKKALVVSDFAMATMGYVMIIIFATQPSVLQAIWRLTSCCYRRNAAIQRRAEAKMYMEV